MKISTLSLSLSSLLSSRNLKNLRKSQKISQKKSQNLPTHHHVRKKEKKYTLYDSHARTATKRDKIAHISQQSKVFLNVHTHARHLSVSMCLRSNFQACISYRFPTRGGGTRTVNCQNMEVSTQKILKCVRRDGCYHF